MKWYVFVYNNDKALPHVYYTRQYATVYDDQAYSPSDHDPNDSHLVYDDGFTVQSTAIPEFPMVIAAIGVAGLCFGIYYWMRKRRPAHVQT